MTDVITVYGIDFTSRPSRRKPITCLECRLVGNSLRPVNMNTWTTFGEFEAFLATNSDGQPWIAAMDFPFGLPLRFLENQRWPLNWPEYIDQNDPAVGLPQGVEECAGGLQDPQVLRGQRTPAAYR